MSYYYDHAGDNRQYYQKRRSYEEPVDHPGNSKTRRFSAPYDVANRHNNIPVVLNDVTEIAQVVDSDIRRLENVEHDDKTNAKIKIEELKLDMKVLEDSNKSLKEHMRHLITDNTLLTNIYDSLYQKHQILTEEMANVKQDNVNFKRINDELIKVKTDFEETFLHVNNYNVELTNKLSVIEEENRKFKNDFANLMADYTKLQCEAKIIKEEPGQIETLSNEIIELQTKCKSYEDEFVHLSEELRKTKEEKSGLKTKNSELLKENKDLNEGKEKTIAKLNKKNNDLKQQCDSIEGEKFQLKGEIRQVKHKLREIEAENTQQKSLMEILEKEKETLLSRCKENDGKKDKIVNENKKFKDLIQEFQGFVQKKVQEIEVDDDEDLNEESEEILILDQNRVEIHPNSGVFCRTSNWKKLEKCEVPKEFCKKLLNLIFAKEELLKCSFKGKRNKPALNQAKVEAFSSCVLKKFPSYSQSDLSRSVNKILAHLQQKATMKK